ncbi:MAG TPA: chemotaxis protein CheW, partial [Gemmatimonadaceae bacterium]|nr:chemotaxis protein CheW [Gemmatimonadaceae bacterium]
MLLLTCTVGGDQFAIDAMRVAEVLPVVSWRYVFGMSNGVVGLLNYHRAVVPLLDLSMLILGTPSTVRMHTRIVMVHADLGVPGRHHVLLGLIAEGNVEMLRCDPAAFVTPDDVLAAAPFLGPVLADTRGIIQWIEIDHLMDAREHD